MAEYTDPDVFIALDESAVDSKTMQRTHGWSPVGIQCVRRMSFLRGVRYSILQPRVSLLLKLLRVLSQRNSF